MLAKELAEKLLEHPDCEVQIFAEDTVRRKAVSVFWSEHYSDHITIKVERMSAKCSSGFCKRR